MITVLHTWGQTLTHHPHVHCVVPGGGLTADGRWIGCRPSFFLPVRVLSRLYRRLFLQRLQAAFVGRKLEFFGALTRLREPAAFARHLAALRDLECLSIKPAEIGGMTSILHGQVCALCAGGSPAPTR